MSSIDELKASLSTLKEKILKLTKMCESTDFKQNDAYEILSEGLIDIINIKQLNSKMQNEIEDLKKDCNKSQMKAEEKNLDYQNYIYQKENIINQIRIFNTYSSPQINKIYGKDTQNITLEKLDNELLNRKRLFEKCNELIKEKSNNYLALKRKENNIKTIPICLNGISDSIGKLKEMLNENLIDSK